MRTIAIACMLVVGHASSAGAVDIKGKWGIGAGVFGGGGEVSLIRGKSERSAWLFDVGINQSYQNSDQEITPPPGFPPGSSTSRSYSILAGPGLRRFTRPTDDFSPYWDIRVRGLYSRLSQTASSGFKVSEAGALTDFAIGLEYFTKWHFSVAAHGSLVRAGVIRSVLTQSVPGTESKEILNREFASIGLQPAVFVRGYF